MSTANIKKKITTLQNIISEPYNKTVDIVVPLHMLYQNMMFAVKNMLQKKYNLSSSELDLLTSLVTANESGILSPTQLSKKLLFSSGGMTKLLKKLEAKNYISRVNNNIDKRSKMVQVTSQGRDITIKAINEVMKYETVFFSNIDDEEKNMLLNIFNKLVSQPTIDKN